MVYLSTGDGGIVAFLNDMMVLKMYTYLNYLLDLSWWVRMLLVSFLT